MLKVNGLQLWRGDRHVLRGVSLQLQPGEVLQLLWPNGVGKTSLLRAIAGLLPVEAGTVLWHGKATQQMPQDWCRDIAYLGHDLSLKGDLTVLENLRYALGLRRTWDVELALSTLQRLGIADYADQLARRLSAGQQRRVALARLMLWDARLWLLDEPAANLDAAGQAQVLEVIGQHVAGAGLVLLSTHQPLAINQGSNRLWHTPGEAP